MFQPQPTPFASSCFTSYGLAPELGFDSEYPVSAGGGGTGAPAGLYNLQPQQQPSAPSHQHPHLAHHPQQPSLSPVASSPFAPSTASTISTTSPPPPTPTRQDTLQTHQHHLHHQSQLQHRPQVQVQHPHQLQHLNHQLQHLNHQQHQLQQLQQLQHRQFQHHQLQRQHHQPCQAPQQSYPPNGVIVPKMEDQEGQHGIAAQQAAAKDYQAVLKGPFVGNKVSSEAITNEYAKADHIYVEKTVALPQTYSHYRPIQGDGNCGWRAIGFAYFEKLIESGDQGKVEGEVARLISFGQMITTVGGYSYFEEWADEMFGLLREIAQNIDNPQMAHMLLLERWNDAAVGGSIIYYLRLVAATYLKANAPTYDPFLPEGAGGVQGYCSQSIELVDREIEHLGIVALTQMLLQPCDFVLEIAYLDRSPGSQVNRYRLPEETNGQDPAEIGPIIYLLYRPDHYDILYVPPPPLPVPVQIPVPAAPVSMQVNRVNSLSHNTPISSTQTNLGEYSSVDFSALSMIPGFMGGMAPLAPPPPAASPAEPYSPASKILCIADLKEAGSKKLPQSARDFYNSGSTEQVTIYENSTAYSKYRVRPRVLVDVSGCDTSTEVFGRKIAFPLSVSPAGLQAMAHSEGELATSRACAKAGVNMGISSYANYRIDQIREAGLSVGPVDHAMQLYTMRDRDLELRIIQEAEKQGCKAIFLTADSPVLGVRFNEWRNDFRTPEGFEFPILEFTNAKIRSTSHDNTFKAFNDDGHNWTRDIPWLRSVTKMEIWIKGILTAEDTLKAIEMGCDGIIVSNHGGRQLDGVPATLDALPECAAAAAGRIRIHIDGGIRTGTDMFKALALGAECCWVGRPALWGLAYDGQKGVELMLETFHNEFRRCMQLTGCNSIADITKACLGVQRPDGPLARL